MINRIEFNSFLKQMFPLIDFDNENELMEGGVFDSLDIFRLIAGLSEKYKLTISFDEISSDNLNSSDSIYSMVCRLLNNES